MRVAVVGSGLGGLLTASLLRARGVDVVRYEKSAHAGGRARAPMLGGISVNLGPRALYRGGPLERALASLEIKPRGFVPPSQGALALEDGALRPLPSTLGELLSEPSLDGADKRAFALALARIAVGALSVGPRDDVKTWLDRHVATARARALVHMLIRTATYSDAPDHDARLALMQTRRALKNGVLYVDGAWEASIVRPLEERAGAPFAPLEQVAQLSDIDADLVIAALGYDEARALLPALATDAVQHQPVTASCLDVVLTSLPKPAHRIALGLACPHYVSVHTPPTTSSAGPVIVHAMVYGAAPRDQLERIMDVFQPGWRDVVVEARYLSRMVVASDLPRAGVPRVAARCLVPTGERVIFVGDYVDTGALLADGVAQSALHAVDVVMRAHSTRRVAA